MKELDQNSKFEYKKTSNKNLFFSFLSLLFSLLIFFGIFFGIFSFDPKEDFKLSDSFKNKYVVEVPVEWNNKNEKDIEIITNYIYRNFKILGLDDFSIETSKINKNKDLITVNFSIDSFRENDEERFSSYIKEEIMVESFYKTSSFLNLSNLEIRTFDGQNLFDSKGNFVQPEKPDPETPRQNKSNKEYQYSLFKEANLKFVNGSPVVEVLPNNLKEFRKAWNYSVDTSVPLPGQAPSEESGKYVVWFGYEEFLNNVNFYDSENFSKVQNNLLNYSYTYFDSSDEGVQKSEMKNISKPFLFSVCEVDFNQSLFDDTFDIIGNFSKEKASLLVSKINFLNYKNNFNINKENLKYYFEINENNRNTINWIFWFLFSIFILISFAFFAFYGVIGVVSSIVNFLLLILFVSFTSIFSIPISLLFANSLILSLIIMFFLQAKILNQFKKNNKIDKKIKTKFGENFLIILKENVSPIIMGILFFAISGIMISNTFIKTFLLVNFLFIFLIVFLNLSLTFLLILFMDIIFKFTFKKEQKKWNLITGYNIKDNKVYVNINKNFLKIENKKFSKKNKKTFSAIFSSLFIMSFLVGLFSLIFVGDFSNRGVKNNSPYYRYNIVLTETKTNKIFEKETNSYISQDNYDDLDYNKDQKTIENLKNKESKIKKYFEKELRVKNFFSSNIIRKDHYRFGEETIPPLRESGKSEIFLDYNYGYSFLTKTKISNDKINSLNSNDSKEEDFSTNGLSFRLDDSSTNFNEEMMGSINLYYDNFNSNYLILLFFIITLILLFMFQFSFKNIAYSLSLITSLFLEFFFISSIIILFFVPINIFFWNSIFTVIFVSIVSKLLLFTRVDSRDKFKKNTFNSLFILIIFSPIILISSIITLIVFGYPALSSFLISFIAIFSIPFSNLFFFKPMLEKLNLKKEKFDSKISQKLDSNSKKEDVISEDFIKGINK